MTEKQIEQGWVKWAKKNNIYHMKTYTRGWPDRVVFPSGFFSDAPICFFIEFKTSKGRLSVLQEIMFKRLEEKGYAVYICRSKEEAIKVCKEYT